MTLAAPVRLVIYYLPDARDVVDPTYDFDTEQRLEPHDRSRDVYAHEIYSSPPYDGLLVSLGVVDASKGRYSQRARAELLACGVREFTRAPDRVLVMGDCGAFSYIKESEPPYSVAELVDFYDRARVDFGLSLDHLVAGFDPGADASLFDLVDPEQRRRRELTLELARDFWIEARGHRFEPVGVAQGWSPRSYAESVTDLEAMGYSYIAIGGVVRLRDAELVSVLHAVNEARRPETRLHLLGIAATGRVAGLEQLGVFSTDCTSPLRRAWMDARHNYWLDDVSYTALRIPSAARVKDGGARARELEAACLRLVEQYSRTGEGIAETLDALMAYGEIHSPGSDRRDDCGRTLADRPWLRCPCSICRRLGHHVILLRGSERSRRRGFHNVWHYYRQLQADRDL